MTNLSSRRSSTCSPNKPPTFSLSPSPHEPSAAIAATNNSNLPFSDSFFANRSRHHSKPPMMMPRHQPTPKTSMMPSTTLSKPKHSHPHQRLRTTTTAINQHRDTHNQRLPLMSSPPHTTTTNATNTASNNLHHTTTQQPQQRQLLLQLPHTNNALNNCCHTTTGQQQQRQSPSQSPTSHATLATPPLPPVNANDLNIH